MGNLSKLIKEYRSKRKFSLRELSTRTGLHHSYIARIESDQVKQPSRETVRRLAQELEAPVNDFEIAAGYIPLDYKKTSEENRKADFVGKEEPENYDSGHAEKRGYDGCSSDHDNGFSSDDNIDSSSLSPKAKEAIKTLYNELFGGEKGEDKG